MAFSAFIQKSEHELIFSCSSIECLRTTDVALLQTANKNAVTAFIVGSSLQFSMTFGPVVDGTFITQRPTEAFKKRKLNGVRSSPTLIDRIAS
jgi:hypothetical protein